MKLFDGRSGREGRGMAAFLLLVYVGQGRTTPETPGRRIKIQPAPPVKYYFTRVH
jgi:hypothetical protein